ncbi:DUF177 domain-containing protein [Pedobacter sp. HMF7647]|uniref:DUF177 domain-containing protein n=1 Tax=Hufsiella arboris TaxID=2695275 RepID=A0A7K1Y8Z9_9SPHI|nr:DUF177 domain-containing protein [Hufsiella arboris]MXV51066.1 DUF177 domain-containing protein [Hufsiella arboris]
MKSLQQYRVPFSGLKLGKHQFEFDVDESFFREFEYSLVKNGTVKVDMELDKQETMLLLTFHIKGDIFLDCDVCLSGFPVAIDFNEKQIVKFGEDDLEENTEEIMVLNRNEHEIDIAPLVYEYINLSVPYINRCNDVGNTEWCDKEMINKLNDLSIENNETHSDDPRWEALKKIKNN